LPFRLVSFNQRDPRFSSGRIYQLYRAKKTGNN
jgi:hypothetical protein